MPASGNEKNYHHVAEGSACSTTPTNKVKTFGMLMYDY